MTKTSKTPPRPIYGANPIKPMKPLPLTFTKNGFLFTQRQREGNIAIYGKRRPNWKEGVETFEVVKISQNKAWICHGKPIEAAEGYPSSEQWGDFGWSEPTIERARARVATLRPSGASKRLECPSIPVKNGGAVNNQTVQNPKNGGEGSKQPKTPP